MKKAALIMATTALCILAGCEGQNQDQKPTISFSGDITPSPVFSNDGGRITIAFTSSDDWTISISSGEWLTANRTDGEAGSVSVELTAAANPDSDSRSTFLTIMTRSRAASASKTITVTQACAIILDCDTFSVPSEGGEYSVKQLSGITAKIEVKDSWIHSTDTTAQKNSVIKFTVDANQTITERNSEIIFYNQEAGVRHTVKVQQSGAKDPGPFVDNNFTRNCTQYGIYDLADPETPELIRGYEEIKEQIAFGSKSEGLYSRIQNISDGYIVTMEYGSHSTTTGTGGLMRLYETGVPELHTGTFNVTVDKHFNGRLWLEDTSAKTGFIMATE